MLTRLVNMIYLISPAPLSTADITFITASEGSAIAKILITAEPSSITSGSLE